MLKRLFNWLESLSLYQWTMLYGIALWVPFIILFFTEEHDDPTLLLIVTLTIVISIPLLYTWTVASRWSRLLGWRRTIARIGVNIAMWAGFAILVIYIRAAGVELGLMGHVNRGNTLILLLVASLVYSPVFAFVFRNNPRINTDTNKYRVTDNSCGIDMDEHSKIANVFPSEIGKWVRAGYIRHPEPYGYSVSYSMKDFRGNRTKCTIYFYRGDHESAMGTGCNSQEVRAQFNRATFELHENPTRVFKNIRLLDSGQVVIGDGAHVLAALSPLFFGGITI